jgi:hypothetical protein
MLAPGVVDEIRSLLASESFSQGEIARRLGVSRGTVNAIATGRRTAEPARPSAGEDFTYGQGPPRRCPGCGGLVQMPCLACRVRAIQRRQRGRGTRSAGCGV